MAPSAREEYAELMKHNPDGHYLYVPQPYSTLHPGSIGYFNKYGSWIVITDLAEKGRPEKDGYTGIDDDLPTSDPREYTWNSVSSGSEAESSYGLSGGLSGAVSAAPVDVSANAKNKTGSTGKAALITTEKVKHVYFVDGAGSSIAGWVKKNAKALVNSKFGDDIKDYGLWAIHTTWSTPECAITLDSAHTRDTSAGLDVGATGIAKVGVNGSSLQKLESKGWRTYQASESEKALVVSYGGAGFKLHRVKMFHKNDPLKQTERTAGDQDEFYERAYDEAGNEIDPQLYRHVRDENGEIVGKVKVDKEAERKAKEEQEEEDDEDFFISSEAVGMSAEDAGTDEAKPAGDSPEEKERQQKEFQQKVEEAMKIPDEGQRKAELAKLLEANSTTEVSYI